ncbi:hypothetical protein C6P46_001104 [Rhodotorula mucilaginosa]|uniref:Uncharacterized protein n=1 Tax=Rhodotorula mucilaginosa TaxID=5537 RepID=A0A9P6VUD3_RHOMI|nr:hypothetical protein C6P46_001104 [Rhodotorula mucilaginosa]
MFSFGRNTVTEKRHSLAGKKLCETMTVGAWSRAGWLPLGLLAKEKLRQRKAKTKVRDKGKAPVLDLASEDSDSDSDMDERTRRPRPGMEQERASRSETMLPDPVTGVNGEWDNMLYFGAMRLSF